jgi:hypothetical protein
VAVVAVWLPLGVALAVGRRRRCHLDSCVHVVEAVGDGAAENASSLSRIIVEGPQMLVEERWGGSEFALE